MSLLNDLSIENDWNAQWIWQSQGGPSDTWMCFRKTFVLPAGPAHAPAFISADSKYWLYVNGKLVVREGGLKRGPAPGEGYYDSLDLAPWLTSGPNTIAALVTFWGTDGFSHQNSGQGGFLFQVDTGGTIVASDSTWKACVHPAFEHCESQPNYRIPERSVRFNGGNDIPCWNATDFDDSSWRFATAKGSPPIAPWGRLRSRPIPFWKDSQVLEYTNASSLGLPRFRPGLRCIT